MKAKMLEEHGSHFVMHDGEAQFRVPKQGLSEALQGKIRAMGEPQKMAWGDVVGALPERRGAPAPMFTFDPNQGNVVPAPAVPPAFTGAELGLSSVPPGAELSLPPPEPPGQRLPPGMKLAPGPEKTLEATGEKSPSGAPMLRQVEALVDKPLPAGLRLKGGEPPAMEQTPARPAALGAARPAGPLPGTVDFAHATEEGRAAAEAKGRVEAEQARNTAQALVEGDKVLQAHALEQKRNTETAHAQATQLLNQAKAAQDEMRNIDTTVDPGRFWASRTTAQKITGIIGLALGAFGSGDGVNRAAAMLNQAIDRDIDAQKAEHGFRLQKGKAAVDAAQSMYGMNHQIFQDDLAAGAASRATALDIINNKLQQVAATSASPLAKANAAALSAKLLEGKAKFDSDAANIAYDNTTARISANAQAAAAGAKATGLDPKSKDLLMEVESRNRSIQENGKKLQALIDAYGTAEKLAPGIEAQMRQLAGDIAVDKVKLADPNSIVSPSEKAAAAEDIFNPGFLQRSSAAKAQIQSTMDAAAARRKSSYESRGVR